VLLLLQALFKTYFVATELPPLRDLLFSNPPLLLFFPTPPGCCHFMMLSSRAAFVLFCFREFGADRFRFAQNQHMFPLSCWPSWLMCSLSAFDLHHYHPRFPADPTFRQVMVPPVVVKDACPPLNLLFGEGFVSPLSPSVAVYETRLSVCARPF